VDSVVTDRQKSKHHIIFASSLRSLGGYNDPQPTTSWFISSIHQCRPYNHAHQCVRLPAWSFLSIFYSNLPSALWCCSCMGARKRIWPVKTEWWGAGVVICLKPSANDLHMVQLMSIPPIISFQNGLPFWYWLTQVVLEKKLLNGRSSSTVTIPLKSTIFELEMWNRQTDRQTDRRTDGQTSDSFDASHTMVAIEGQNNWECITIKRDVNLTVRLSGSSGNLPVWPPCFRFQRYICKFLMPLSTIIAFNWWQVTPCDPIWHMSSHIGEGGCKLLFR